MKYNVRHLTRVTYAQPVAHARFNLRLVPWVWPGQVLGKHRLLLTPEPARRDELAGPYCVNTTRIGFERPLTSLEVVSEFAITVTSGPEPDCGAELAQVAREALVQRDVSALAAAPFLFASRIAAQDAAIGGWAAQFLARQVPIVQAASALMHAIHRDFTYAKGATNATTPPAEAFAQKKGVCQDFAHIMIMALRAHGIPAGYASGYLRTLPPPGGQRLVGADAMHAWVNVWCGAALGWIGFDPTNDRLAQDQHIQIAFGRDYADVAPIDGTFIGSAPQTMQTLVDVQEVG